MDSIDVPQEASDCPSGEQSMRTCSVNLGGSLVPQCFCSPTDGAAGSDHVVHDGYLLSCNIKILRLVHDGVCIDSSFL